MEEAQRYIDIEGLLNIARGFTGYGLTLSDAVRYTLYKISLPYHTAGWVRSEWVQTSRKESSEAIASKMEARKESIEYRGKSAINKTVDKKDLQALKETIKFRQEYKDELGKLEKWTTEIEEVKEFLKQEDFDWERVNQLLSEQGYGVNHMLGSGFSSSSPPTERYALRRREYTFYNALMASFHEKEQFNLRTLAGYAAKNLN